MESLVVVLSFAVLCGAWVCFQRWVARIDPEIGNDPHCGGCCADKLCKIENGEVVS